MLTFSEEPLPFYAPLNRPMIERALAYQEISTQEEPVRSLSLSNALSEIAAKYSLLRERVQASRTQVFQTMEPAIQEKRFTSEWMRDQLQVSAESLHRWRESGLVVYEDRDAPDPDSGAAVSTLRLLIPDRARGWLPMPPPGKRKENYFAQEPLWFAWRQDSPTSPVVSCPIPLSPNIPSSALIWTDWLGAAWKPAWLRIGQLGCCRWAGTLRVGDTLRWDLTEDALELWGIPIAAGYKKALKNDLWLTRHHLAESALLVLATERLEEMQRFSFHTLSLLS